MGLLSTKVPSWLRSLRSRWLVAGCCVAAAMLLHGCVIVGAIERMDTGTFVEGRVFDAATGEPLGDVHVLAGYETETSTPAHSESICYRVEYQKVGADGTFRFPIDGRVKPWFRAYKAGYAGAGNPRGVGARALLVDGREVWRYSVGRFDPAVLGGVVIEGVYATREEAEQAARIDDRYLMRSTASPVERLDYLWSYVSGTGCANARKTRPNIVPFLLAVRAELETLKGTPGWERWMTSLDSLIESKSLVN